MKHLDYRVVDLISVNSLGFWVHLFPYFVELIRHRHCSYWKQNDDVEGCHISNAPNECENEGTFNVCRLIDVSVHKTCTPGSGPNGEGPNCSPERKLAHAIESFLRRAS